MKNEADNIIYFAGMQAYQDGFTVFDNPYDYDTQQEKYQVWDAGWSDAEWNSGDGCRFDGYD